MQPRISAYPDGLPVKLLLFKLPAYTQSFIFASKPVGFEKLERLPEREAYSFLFAGIFTAFIFGNKDLHNAACRSCFDYNNQLDL